MKKYIDISEFINIDTIQSITQKIVNNFVLRRKEQGLSRKSLSIKSGVSYGSIRRFEETGNISLYSLLRLSQTLDQLNGFNGIFKNKVGGSLKDDWEKENKKLKWNKG